MSKIYGVSFKDNGKIYYFDGRDLEIEANTKVIVATEKGEQFGKVVGQIPKEETKNEGNYKEIIRVSNQEDYEIYLNNLADADKALQKAKKIAKELNLQMNFIDAQYTYDRRQLLFNFLADERVDFRELAKRLAAIYRTRIELRQIGIRDKAKEIGGLGMCGRQLCCSNFLNNSDSITMNMAKNQNIPLNPNKINGSCGRLLCCLAYEDEEYTCCSVGMPKIGETLKTPKGTGEVISIDILNRKYKVNIEGEKFEIEIDSCAKDKFKGVKR